MLNKVAPFVPNELNADSRKLTDEALWAGLNLNYPPLTPVRDALKRGDTAAARKALVEHFRSRCTPKITQYHTDPHWVDWENSYTLLERADMLAEYKVCEIGDEPKKVCDIKGIDWSKALSIHHIIKRQGGMATLARAWALTGKSKYAHALQIWMESLWKDVPFVLDPNFDPEEFFLFGGKEYPQLSSAYMMFVWADVLDSKLMRAKNVLSDDFWFEFIKHTWFMSFQFTRFIGSSWRADNHHLMERGTASYFLGVGFPEFKYAKKLEVYAREMILRHFDHNLLKDNTGSEACMAYQYRCFIRYGLPDSVARINGKSLLGKAREKKLKDWLEFQGYMTAPDGRLPDTGDGAGPTLQVVCRESGAFYRNALLKGVAESLKKKINVNQAFLAAWNSTLARKPCTLAKIYPSSGNMVLRDSWRSDANWLWFGAKNDSLYDIHNHWNTFGFILSAFGRRIIGHPNSRAYGKTAVGSLARGYYLSMDAHNTLVIDHDTIKVTPRLQIITAYSPPVSVRKRCVLTQKADSITLLSDMMTIAPCCTVEMFSLYGAVTL